MPITEHEIAPIRRIAAETTGVDVRVFLIGLRTWDDLRDGAIDLLNELPTPGTAKLVASLRTCARLQRLIGGRKIDVLVTGPQTDDTPLTRTASRGGIAL